jgi:predicted lipoprotein with Yx(FWY)xxD motif
MKSSTLVWVVIIVIVIAGAWYWMSMQTAPGTAGDGTASTALGVQGSNDQTNTGQATSSPLVAIAHDATLGDYLVAENGMTLYRYTKDVPDVSNCTGTCAENWPPYIHMTNEPLMTGAGVTGTLTTIARDDGSTQIAYNDVPLYFWKNDTKPGDTTGQDVGGVWFVVKP